MACKDTRKISKFVSFQDLIYGSSDYISAKIATKHLTSKFCRLIFHFVIIICFVFRCCSSFSNSGGSVSILVLPLCFMLSGQLLVQEKAEVAQGFVAGHLVFLFIIVSDFIYFIYKKKEQTEVAQGFVAGNLEFQLIRELKTFTHIRRGLTASLQILSGFL